MSIPRFNRHEHMDSLTRSMILDTIGDLNDCPLGHSTRIIENWLYGSFDGFDYSDIAIVSNELKSVTLEDPALGLKLLLVFDKIKNYPKENYETI
jgi:hypothetical protein